jgi:hypothetical protein
MARFWIYLNSCHDPATINPYGFFDILKWRCIIQLVNPKMLEYSILDYPFTDLNYFLSTWNNTPETIAIAE